MSDIVELMDTLTEVREANEHRQAAGYGRRVLVLDHQRVAARALREAHLREAMRAVFDLAADQADVERPSKSTLRMFRQIATKALQEYDGKDGL